jgi:putative hydrolase of the HAD superfamily
LQLLGAVCEAGGRALGTLASETARIDELLARQRGGECSIDQAVAEFASARGVKGAPALVDRYKAIALSSVPQFFVPQPDARAVLDALSARAVPYAILSNGWSPLQQAKAAQLAFAGPVVVSDEIGAQKPQPQAFAALARALGVAAAEIAYVGDNPQTDCAGAAGAGMRAIWLDAEDVRYEAGLPQPDAVIHSLTELLAIL